MTFTLDKYMPYSVGFDTLFDRLGSLSAIDVKGYPYYNIKKADDTQRVIELALAGFSKDDIEIEVKDNVMNIKGELKEDNNEFVYKGISSKRFSKSFTLAEFTECESAQMENGILSITLEKNIPEDKKPQKVKIK